MNSKKWLYVIILCGATTNALAAICEYYPGHSSSTLTFTLPTSSSVPRDAPNGTVLYESSTITYAGNNSYTCSSTYSRGAKNYVGKDVSGDTNPIGDTGIGWQWIYQGSPLAGILSNNTGSAGGYGFNGTTTALKFIKIGPIKDNARIPAGLIGGYQIGTITPLTIETNGMSIVVPSCETPDVIVPMGSQNLSNFSNSKPNSASILFNIKLNNCPTGIKKVNYSFITTSTAPALDPALGIISLNSTSTAKGFALQIMNDNERPVNLNLTHAFTDYSAIGGNFVIPMLARYIIAPGAITDGTIKAGTANSEITFVMSYL